MRYSIFLAGLSSTFVGAIKPPLPHATDALGNNHVDLKDVSPKPTKAPELLHLGLMRRASAGSSEPLIGWVGKTLHCQFFSLTSKLAPDNTCGYVAGSIGALKSCSTGELCGAVAITVSNTVGGVMACFPGTDSADQPELLGPCINYAEYYSSSSCDQVCQQDINTVKWYVLCFNHT
jgi:hypothetical protein